MKKTYLFFSGLFLILLAANCQFKQSNTDGSGGRYAEVVSGSGNNLSDRGALVLNYLKNRNFKQLASLVHEDKGVTFSPYAFVEKQAVKFTAAQLKTLKLTDKFQWGYYDGSGEPMDLNVGDYFKKFVFDQDFTRAPETGLNRLVKTGNTISNLDKAFPGARFIEYHFPGFNPQYEGIDWVSLRLVFEEVKGQLMLVGVVHDAWTI